MPALPDKLNEPKDSRDNKEQNQHLQPNTQQRKTNLEQSTEQGNRHDQHNRDEHKF